MAIYGLAIAHHVQDNMKAWLLDPRTACHFSSTGSLVVYILDSCERTLLQSMHATCILLTAWCYADQCKHCEGTGGSSCGARPGGESLPPA